MELRGRKDLSAYDGPDQIISSHEMALKFSEEKNAIIQVKSLIPTLDNFIEDFRAGELIVISGPTKNGKTLFAQSLTANFAKQQYFSTWFTFEVQARQFLSQFPQLPLIYLPSRLKAHALDWLEDRVCESFQKNR